METIQIIGPARLEGEIELSGAKNAALPILLAAFAVEGTVTLQSVPTGLNDIRVLMEILHQLGGELEETAPGEITITKTKLETCQVDTELGGKIRSSLLFMGLLTGRMGRCRLGVPGGCPIGERAYDLHLSGLEALGAKIRITDEFIELEGGKLKGTDISLPIATTSGTENLMIAACFAEGVTRIFNAHTRPEIIDLANMLNTFGADIRVSQRRIEIHGGRPLHGGTYRIMPAWDEAVTLMAATVMTGGELCIRNLSPETIRGDVLILREAGAEVFAWGGHLFTKGPEKLREIHVVTGPFPGINSDLQPIYAAMCCGGGNECTVTDTRFPDRFAYVEEIRKLGADIDYYENCVVIRGGQKMRGCPVTARDLRCGAALAVAALASEGTTTISNVYQLDRGYCHFEDTLSKLGVQARRITE